MGLLLLSETCFSSTPKMTIKNSDVKRDLWRGFQPGKYDVICGKGKLYFQHAGNQRFRTTVKFYLEEYSEARTKVDKSKIVTKIIEIVKYQSPEGGFIKFDASRRRWYEVSDHLAREKVGQAFRDTLHLKYQSSTKAKKRRRENQQQEAAIRMTNIIADNNHFELSSMIDKLNSKSTSSMGDNQFTETFTKANLDILNVLKKAGPEESENDLKQSCMSSDEGSENDLKPAFITERKK